MTDDCMRRRFTVTGQVQGVGFRPFVFRIAHGHGLSGFVRNTPEGVVIEVQGAVGAVDRFAHELEHATPPLARIITLKAEALEAVDEADAENEQGFEILGSTGGHGHQVLISPDTATCPDCLAELFDPSDRRHLYPFTNCTNCGPRYTITRSIPYDRATTSMDCFPMCERCRAEYEDPRNRRFHAQPNACPECGPRIWLAKSPGPDGDASGTGFPGEVQGQEAIRRAAELLAQGAIMGIKGLGGFHLACDASNQEAVLALRERKGRRDKPLAVMVPDLESVKQCVIVEEAEEKWLEGMQRPIVLCRQRFGQTCIAPAVAPDTHFLGLMLPYTPFHHVLLHALREQLPEGGVPALVMTSGNMSSEPICLGNREAVARLKHITDWFLFHDRDILIRTDDSVMRVLPDSGRPQYLRRARGFTPKPIFLAPLDGEEPPCVLGVGPELKNTVCLTKNGQAFVGQHVGDMQNLETEAFHGSVIDHLSSILQVQPSAIVRDLHPDYLSTHYAEGRGGVPVFALQHHYAHIHAVLAEHAHRGPAIGLALDGTGYGEDGTLWGGEVLLVDTETLRHKRLAHFAPVPLPGGEAAIREPWRIAQAYLWELGVTEAGKRPWTWWLEFGEASDMLPQILEKRINCPLSTSCGRLFDAVAALLGVKHAISYEGQAAIVLEKVQDGHFEDRAYEFPLKPGRTDDAPALLDTLALFAQVHDDWARGVPIATISRMFHLGVAQGLAEAAACFAQQTGVRDVALSGGVMQNLTLAVELPRALLRHGLNPLSHERVPPNDGCISLGQAAWGRLKIAHDGI